MGWYHQDVISFTFSNRVFDLGIDGKGKSRGSDQLGFKWIIAAKVCVPVCIYCHVHICALFLAYICCTCVSLLMCVHCA